MGRNKEGSRREKKNRGVANTYSITILLETYLSRSTRYQDHPGLTLWF